MPSAQVGTALCFVALPACLPAASSSASLPSPPGGRLGPAALPQKRETRAALTPSGLGVPPDAAQLCQHAAGWPPAAAAAASSLAGDQMGGVEGGRQGRLLSPACFSGLCSPTGA